MNPTTLELLRRLREALRDTGLSWSIGGGLAVHAHGHRRETRDVDAFFHLDDADRVARALRKAGFELDWVFDDVHLMAFVPGLSRDPRERVDVLFSRDEPELSAIDGPVEAEVEGERFPAFPVELLVVSKLYSDRLQDLADVEALHRLGAFDPEEVRRLLGRWEPELIRTLDEVLSGAWSTRKRRGRRGRYRGELGD